jgi:MFS family permease
MWFSNFLVSASATMVVPFLSLYIETLGDYPDQFVKTWSGYVFGVTFFMAFLVSPIWGRIGDRHGYKTILLITGTGIATSILCMGFVHSVYQLFLLRALMGLVTGFIPTSLAMISAQTPKHEAGKTLGTLQMGTVSGGLFGPLIGGLLADRIGFTYTFFITSFSIYLAVLLVLIGVKPVAKKTSEKNTISRKEVFTYIFHQRSLLIIMMMTLIIQIGNFSLQPLLALYVSELHGPQNLSFFAGLAFSATGLGNLLFARKWGQLGDRFGHDKILVTLLLLAGICFIPQALAETLWVLILFRLLFGMVLGGIIPCITAYIRLKAPAGIQGEVLGYNVSFRFLGNVTGPVLGGIVSGWYGISAVFYVTSVLFLFGGCLLWKQNAGKSKSLTNTG